MEGKIEEKDHRLKKERQIQDSTLKLQETHGDPPTLFRLKNKEDPMKQAGLIYKIKCIHCNKSYIGKTLRPLLERLKEHQTETEDPEISEAKYTREE